MVKVWVVLMEDYAGKQQLVDVYSTREKAEKPGTVFWRLRTGYGLCD